MILTKKVLDTPLFPDVRLVPPLSAILRKTPRRFGSIRHGMKFRESHLLGFLRHILGFERFGKSKYKLIRVLHLSREFTETDAGFQERSSRSVDFQDGDSVLL